MVGILGECPKWLQENARIPTGGAQVSFPVRLGPAGGKSEIRNPNAEARKKPEI
jgi:hypothetical protein